MSDSDVNNPPADPAEEDGQPTQTDNRPRPEDGDQDVDQTEQAPGGSPQ